MSAAKHEKGEVVLLLWVCHIIDAITEVPAAGSAANFTVPVANDKHVDYSGELGELCSKDNVTNY